MWTFLKITTASEFMCVDIFGTWRCRPRIAVQNPRSVKFYETSHVQKSCDAETLFIWTQHKAFSIDEKKEVGSKLDTFYQHNCFITARHMQESWEANSSRIGRKNSLAAKVIQNKGRITKGLLMKVSSALG